MSTTVSSFHMHFICVQAIQHSTGANHWQMTATIIFQKETQSQDTGFGIEAIAEANKCKLLSGETRLTLSNA